MTKHLTLWLVAVTMGLCLASARADQEVAAPPAEDVPLTQPSGDEAKADTDTDTTTTSEAPATATATEAPEAENAPSADEVIERLLQQRSEPPITPPQRQPVKSDMGSAPVAVPEKNTLGTAPPSAGATEAGRTELRREGTFIISRHGRVVKSPGGARSLFLLDADDAQSPELPLVLLPSQMTQSLEERAADLGERAVFIVTGQVFTYRGANYLLPSMVQTKIDKGNLQH